ncbi:hypothetical protein B9N43_14100 [Denitratisoma sp. DHT3]|uniref:phage holin family protein n=1 Tax=Denitratisoma sp. DHT3 TaxID=1981880 RepID=UPI001198589A|nr:phage holin family protein [Denitratisoma sp. DHT3]QDX82274.1 hypothetical protein B9N43_14100 [Denitratisoma sp. DHT3]
MSEAATPGIFGSLRRLLAHGLELLQTRAELLAVELEQERARLLRLLVAGAVAAASLVVGLAFLAVFVTVLFWDSHRLWLLGGFGIAFLLLGGAALLWARRQGCVGSSLFSASLDELRQDRAALAPRE